MTVRLMTAAKLAISFMAVMAGAVINYSELQLPYSSWTHRQTDSFIRENKSVGQTSRE